MKLFFACLAALTALTISAQAAPQAQRVICNVDAASKCSAAANDRAALKGRLQAAFFIAACPCG
jgi:hypothetical protein